MNAHIYGCAVLTIVITQFSSVTLCTSLLHHDTTTPVLVSVRDATAHNSAAAVFMIAWLYCAENSDCDSYAHHPAKQAKFCNPRLLLLAVRLHRSKRLARRALVALSCFISSVRLVTPLYLFLSIWCGSDSFGPFVCILHCKFVGTVDLLVVCAGCVYNSIII